MMKRLFLLSIGLGLYSATAYAQLKGERIFLSAGGTISYSTRLNKPRISHPGQYLTLQAGDLTSFAPVSIAYYTPENVALYTDFSIIQPVIGSDSLWKRSLEKEYGGRFYETGSGTSPGNHFTTAYQFRFGAGYRKAVKYWHFAPKILFGFISGETSISTIQLKEKNTNFYYEVELEQNPVKALSFTISPTFTIGFKPGNRAFRLNFEMGYAWINGTSGYRATLINQLDKTSIIQSERQRANGHYLSIGGGISWDIGKLVSK
jgi:hypothetical protein